MKSRVVLPRLFLSVLSMAFSFTASAQFDEMPRGEESGRKLATVLCSLRPAENADWSGTLKVSRNHKTTSFPVACAWTTGDSTWSVTYLVPGTNSIPAERLTISFFTNQPPVYYHARALSPGAPLPPPVTLHGAEANIPFADSDFWLSDLGFDFFHWPKQNLLPSQIRRSQPCYVLESTNPNPATNAYSKVVIWIHKDALAPLDAEAYGPDARLLKQYQPGSFKKINGRYELKDLEIRNVQTGSRTQILFNLPVKQDSAN